MPLNAIVGFLNPTSDTFFLKIAFIPSDGYFDTRLHDMRDMITAKLPIIQQILDTFDSVVSSNYYDSTWDGLDADFGGLYGLDSVNIVDSTFVNTVAPRIKFWLSGIFIFFTIRALMDKIIHLFGL